MRKVIALAILMAWTAFMLGTMFAAPAHKTEIVRRHVNDYFAAEAI